MGPESKQAIKEIESWASIFERPEDLGKAVTLNYFHNKDGIKADLAKEETDWAAGSYQNAGTDFADLALAVIGPIPTQIDVADKHILPDIDISLHMVDHVLAGFIYGMTEQNHLTEIEACWTGGEDLEKEIMTAVHSFKAGGWDNITQGVLYVLLAGLQMPQELHTCKGMTDDINAIESWAANFSDKSKLVGKVTKHFIMHKKDVTADIATLKTEWAAKEYFAAGEEVATLASILIGPIQ